MLQANVAYIGIVTCICTFVGLVMNMYYTRLLVPDIRLKMCYVHWIKVKELISAGIWNSISRLSQVLSDGLDLVITNIWISAYLMAECLSSKNQYECLFGIISQYRDSDNLKSLPYIPFGSILFSMHTPVILPHNYARYETSEFQFFSFHPLFSYPRHNFIFHNTSFRMIQ